MKTNTNKKLFFILGLLAAASVILYSGCSKNKDEGNNTPIPTCSDGIQNQGETGVDCGGPCSPCPLSARDSVVLDYNTNYLGSSVTDPGWTGDVGTCNAGTVPQSTHDAVIKRLNYFRRLVSLNSNCTLDASKFAMEQETALMMDANGMSNHFPPTSWLCWTQLGYDGAGSSNLYYGVPATNAVTGFIQDPGASNTACGHRRWILYSSQNKFSYGTTNLSMALYVFNTGNNTQIPEFIAYPPKGYIPQQLVFPRWSFGKPGANFSAASVSMTGPSGNVPLTVLPVAVGYGDPTLAWEPTGIITNSTSDVTYTVTVSGITGAPSTSYTYNVVIIKP